MYITLLMVEDIIQKFLNNFESKNTIKNYKRALKDYFIVLNVKDPNTYFKSNRDYKADVKKFCESLLDMAPKTFNGKIAGIKSLFDEHEILFPKKTVKDFQIRIIYYIKTILNL